MKAIYAHQYTWEPVKPGAVRGSDAALHPLTRNICQGQSVESAAGLMPNWALQLLDIEERALLCKPDLTSTIFVGVKGSGRLGATSGAALQSPFSMSDIRSFSGKEKVMAEREEEAYEILRLRYVPSAICASAEVVEVADEVPLRAQAGEVLAIHVLHGPVSLRFGNATEHDETLGHRDTLLLTEKDGPMFFRDLSKGVGVSVFVKISMSKREH
ncbi:hypothetical protein [Polycladidibacter hongkongensis]|uniref:hypothetical protein n=1 Tax=Polycladidibacter hongkongensis TaxID=1647556 RepID=UPI0008310A51|nr:hypothetical protein [Pseudovibrio hongkongensis]